MMARQLKPKYTTAELLRFPIVFGTLLFAAVAAFYNRKSILPSPTEEQRNKARGSEKDKELLLEAMKNSQR